MERHASSTIAISIGGSDYIAVPVAEYRRLVGSPADGLAGTDAAAYANQRITRTLKAARRHAGLTQSALADKLHVGQGHIANSEAGRERFGVGFVARWIKACGLPADWKPGKA